MLVLPSWSLFLDTLSDELAVIFTRNLSEPRRLRCLVEPRFRFVSAGPRCLGWTPYLVRLPSSILHPQGNGALSVFHPYPFRLCTAVPTLAWDSSKARDPNHSVLGPDILLVCIPDHSIFDGFSKVVQRLIPQLATLENMLNALISVRTYETCGILPSIYCCSDGI